MCDDNLKNMKVICSDVTLEIFFFFFFGLHLMYNGDAVHVIATWHTLIGG